MSKRFKYEKPIVEPKAIVNPGLPMNSRAPEPLPDPEPADVRKLRKEVKERQAQTYAKRRGFK